jgi:hypothetical protein
MDTTWTTCDYTRLDGMMTRDEIEDAVGPVTEQTEREGTWPLSADHHGDLLLVDGDGVVVAYRDYPVSGEEAAGLC